MSEANKKAESGSGSSHCSSSGQPDTPKRARFNCWAGQGLPRGWAENMGGRFADFDGDVVWPIVDSETSGPIDGFPTPDQMLCWCPSPEKQSQVVKALRIAYGLPINEDWLEL